MSKFIFENAEELKLSSCSNEGKLAVINNIDKGYTDSLWQDGWHRIDNSNNGGNQDHIELDAVYRVLAKPYTLEDAIAVIQHCFEDSDMLGSEKNDLIDSVTKLAASMGGDK